MNLNTFQSCRLIEGKRWYIVYYQTNPFSSEYLRHRETHNLNRIKKKSERRERAKVLMNEINAKLAGGYPYNLDSESQTLLLRLTPCLDAIQYALELKLAPIKRENSKKNYLSRVHIFKEWIKQKGFDNLKIGEFHSIYAQQFFNYLLIERKLSSVTYNSYIVHIREIFNILKKQFYIVQNPVEHIAVMKETPTKIRNRFKADIRTAFVELVQSKNDEWFMLALVLQYYFFLRPVEISRLKVSAIDFEKWEIELPSYDNKTYKERTMKIPEVAKKFFPDKLRKFNKSWFLLGSGVKPSAKVIYKSALYRRNLKYLKILETQGFDIEGLTFYSWKDTGGFDMLNENEKITVFDVQDRMGHSDIKTTKRYVASNDRAVDNIRNEL